MAVRMKGKEMTNHQHSKKDNRHSLVASHLMATMTTIRSLMAIPILTATKITSDSLEGLGLRTATCTAQPSQGTFADARRKSNRNGLLSPDGNFGVKSPDILEGLFEKSFCSTKQVTQFLSSQKFLGLLAGSQTVSFFLIVLYSIPFHQ